MSRYLPQALGVTGLVVAGPVVAVWALRAWQVIGSTPVAVAIGVIMSLAVSFGGSAYWANRDSSRDVLFSELMIWGWLRRWRAEHKLTAALEHLEELTAAGVAREGTPRLAMLTELAEALEAGDPYTRNHSRRVARYSSMIAERLGFAADDVDRIRTAAMVHDVGKVRTPIEVLHKPGKLTDEEYAVIKTHPVDGAQLVEALRDDRLTAIVRHHHERLDGRGYPDGLRGDAIPLGARIVAVADTFDAITSARAYRPASPHRKALDILIKEAGTQLDADAVRAFRACYTGRRPFALWMTMLAFPQRLTASLGSGTTAASAASIPKVVMAASAVAVVGGAAASARPLMVVPATPQVAATVAASASASATATSHSPAQHAAAIGTVSVPGAVGAKLASPAVQTREEKMLRRPRHISRRFPTAPAATHRAASSSSHTSAAPQSTTSPSAPVSAPPTSDVPVSTPTPDVPVSTVAAAPATTTPTMTTPATPAGSGSDRRAGSTHGTTKDHGKGSGTDGKGSGTDGKGSGTDGIGTGHDQGTGATKTKTKSKTTAAPTTTPPTANPPGNGDGNGNGNGNGKANGHGNGNGNATTSAGGTGNGNGNPDAAGNGKDKRTGNASAGGAGNGGAGGTFSMGGTDGPTGTGNGNGAGNGNGSTATTGNGNGSTGNGNGSTGTTGDGNAGGNGRGNGHPATPTPPSAG